MARYPQAAGFAGNMSARRDGDAIRAPDALPELVETSTAEAIIVVLLLLVQTARLWRVNWEDLWIVTRFLD